MRTNRNLLAIAAWTVVCVVVVWLSASIQGVENTYEIHPEITIPEYRTDAARAIDAYERLMQRYMDITEKNLIRLSADIKSVVRKLDSIDSKLRELSTRIAKIEKAVGVEQPKTQIGKKTCPAETQEEIYTPAPSKLSPSAGQ